MKIKYSKDYNFLQLMHESDIRSFRRGFPVTMKSDYSGTWEDADVTIEQLQEYVCKGYAIRINC